MLLKPPQGQQWNEVAHVEALRSWIETAVEAHRRLGEVGRKLRLICRLRY
jgi:hypothetical protein